MANFSYFLWTVFFLSAEDSPEVLHRNKKKVNESKEKKKIRRKYKFLFDVGVVLGVTVVLVLDSNVHRAIPPHPSKLDIGFKSKLLSDLWTCLCRLNIVVVVVVVFQQSNHKEGCRGVARIFQRGSHCVKHYRHGVFATDYCRLFA